MPAEISNQSIQKSLSAEQINSQGVQYLRQQPMQEFIVDKQTFSDGQRRQIKIPNLGILAGLVLRVNALWSLPNANVFSVRQGAHVANLLKDVNLKLSDGTTRHQGSRGYHIQQVLERYQAFNGFAPNHSYGVPVDTTNRFMTTHPVAPANNTCAVEGIAYIPVEIPAGGMFEGGYNLMDAARGNADNFLSLTLAPVSEYAQTAGNNLYPWQIFDADAVPTLVSCEIEVTMLFRQPTNVLPILALATVYSIDTHDHQSAKQNGDERFEVEAAGYGYLQVIQQLTDGGKIPLSSVAADSPAFSKTQLVLFGNQSRYQRFYRTQRINQRNLSPYAPVDCLIHDWRDYPLTANTNGSLVLVNTMNVSGYTAPLITTTYERVRRGTI